MYLPRCLHTSMSTYMFHTERARKLKGKNRCWVARPHSQQMWHLTFHQIEPFRSPSCLREVRSIDKTPAQRSAFQTSQKTPASAGQSGRTEAIQSQNSTNTASWGERNPFHKKYLTVKLQARKREDRLSYSAWSVYELLKILSSFTFQYLYGFSSVEHKVS